MWLSRSIIFGVVPDATSAWKPDTEPHMMQMNRNGKMSPGNVGPPCRKVWLTVGHCNFGLARNTPSTNRAMGIVQAMVNVPHELPGTSWTHPADKVTVPCCGLALGM